MNQIWLDLMQNALDGLLQRRVSYERRLARVGKIMKRDPIPLQRIGAAQRLLGGDYMQLQICKPLKSLQQVGENGLWSTADSIRI